MNALANAYQKARLKTSGEVLAEIEIEARRDAREIQDRSKCPYELGTFAALCYHDEVIKIRKENGI